MYRQRFKTTDERFDEKYTIAPNGCWLWIRGKDARHPEFWCDGVYAKASHYSWQRANRKLRVGEWVLHKCDTPKCVNPDHLFVGNQTDNMRDRSRKGRGNHPTGERNGRARVTRFVVEEIRRLYVPRKVSQQFLGDKFGLAQVTVSQIIRHRIWNDG